jgi:hypothetical protein
LPLITRTQVLSSKVLGEKIIAFANNGGTLLLTEFNLDLEMENKIAEYRGFRGGILDAQEDGLLLAVDNLIINVDDGASASVLEAHLPINFFWHSARVGDSIYVQEYGESPTGIWCCNHDRTIWHLLTTNSQINRASKHFHSIAYDVSRRQLIATLGDVNTVRVAASYDEGKTWRPLYRGPWQFAPIASTADKIVFGMDSGLAKGGVAIYYPREDSWEFVFLKWFNENVRFSQMCDLKQLSNGLWLAALGTPQALVISKDLMTWYSVFKDEYSEQFNHYMMIDEGRDFVTLSTGKKLLLFKNRELESAIGASKPVLFRYGAYLHRLEGRAFLMRRIAVDTFLRRLDWRNRLQRISLK